MIQLKSWHWQITFFLLLFYLPCLRDKHHIVVLRRFFVSLYLTETLLCLADTGENLSLSWNCYIGIYSISWRITTDAHISHMLEHVMLFHMFVLSVVLKSDPGSYASLYLLNTFVLTHLQITEPTTKHMHLQWKFGLSAMNNCLWMHLFSQPTEQWRIEFVKIAFKVVEVFIML